MQTADTLRHTTLGELDPALAYKAQILVATFELPHEWQVLRHVEPAHRPGHTVVRTHLGTATLADSTPVRVRPYP